MPNVLRDIPSSAALTPEPHLDTWEEHEHLMNPMFLQSPDEIDLPPLDPELLDHQRRRQVSLYLYGHTHTYVCDDHLDAT